MMLHRCSWDGFPMTLKPELHKPSRMQGRRMPQPASPAGHSMAGADECGKSQDDIEQGDFWPVKRQRLACTATCAAESKLCRMELLGLPTHVLTHIALLLEGADKRSLRNTRRSLQAAVALAVSKVTVTGSTSNRWTLEAQLFSFPALRELAVDISDDSHVELLEVKGVAPILSELRLWVANPPSRFAPDVERRVMGVCAMAPNLVTVDCGVPLNFLESPCCSPQALQAGLLGPWSNLQTVVVDLGSPGARHLSGLAPYIKLERLVLTGLRRNFDLTPLRSITTLKYVDLHMRKDFRVSRSWKDALSKFPVVSYYRYAVDPQVAGIHAPNRIHKCYRASLWASCRAKMAGCGCVLAVRCKQ